MSVASEIERISGNISESYTAAEEMGATMPANQNSDNLANTIRTISGGSGGVSSVNGKTGAVVLDAEDVGAIPSEENAVTAELIANYNVTTEKLADKAVTAEKLADGAVTPGSIGAVNKAGDTIIGESLGIGDGCGQLYSSDWNTNISHRRAKNDNSFYRELIVTANEGNSRNNSVLLSEHDGSSVAYYNLFGEHNPLMELLWENASPASDFLNQTISLDLSQYDRVHIDFRLSENYAQILGADCKVGDGFMVHYIWGDTGRCAHRTGSVTTSSVKFNAAWYYYNDGNSGISTGGSCQPVRIYGIKGVS